MPLVESKSKITYTKADLTNANNVQSISWSQSLRNKTEDFIQLTATLDDNTTAVVFFVQKSMTDQLLKESTVVKEGEDKYTVTVQAPNFRYGQDSATKTTFRFLVYLDPSYNIYQHRFVNQTTLAKLASLSGKIPSLNAPMAAVKSAISVAQSVFGDPLRSFEG